MTRAALALLSLLTLTACGVVAAPVHLTAGVVEMVPVVVGGASVPIEAAADMMD